MRTIKFRAWINYGNGGSGDDHYQMVYDCIGYTPREFCIGEIVRPSELVLNGIPMQFTGLLDKNGKEIYEGDIIKISKGKAIGIVEYIAPNFQFKFVKNEFKKWSSSKILGGFGKNEHQEIIGNVYENKELLN